MSCQSNYKCLSCQEAAGQCTFHFSLLKTDLAHHITSVPVSLFLLLHLPKDITLAVEEKFLPSKELEVYWPQKSMLTQQNVCLNARLFSEPVPNSMGLFSFLKTLLCCYPF